MKYIIVLLFTFSIMDNLILFDFNSTTNINKWRIIDDGVMGGISSGNFKIDSDGNGVFYGTVSLENNGGFFISTTSDE